MTSSLKGPLANDEFAGGEELPESFQPSKYDVIVGWARQNYHHGAYLLDLLQPYAG
jgi:hypothetical protein